MGSQLVSIIIPVYNREDSIGRAIESVLQQSYDEIELLIVDDGSTDGTAAVIEGYADERVHYIYQENAGANVARNTGINAANGTYISFLDSDDEFDPSYLTKCVSALQSSSEKCIGAFTAHYVTNKEAGIRRYADAPAGEISLTELQHRNVPGSLSTTTWDARVFDEVGMLDTEMPAIQDYEFYLRVARTYTLVGIDEPLLTQYTDTDNRISDATNRRFKGHEKLEEKHGDLLSKQRFAYHKIEQGRLSMYQGDVSTARKRFVEALKLTPTNIVIYIHLVLTLSGSRIYTRIHPVLRNIWIRDELEEL